MRNAYANGLLFDGESIHQGKALLVAEGKVVGVTETASLPSEYTVTDLNGACLSPAFIDLQVYGGGGKMFCDDITPQALATTYAHCRKGGAGWIMITLATNSLETFFRGMEAVQQYWQQGGQGILGLHLEGPYIHPAKKGAHIEQYIHPPTMDEVGRLLEKGKGVVNMMTLAPECCDPAIIQKLLESGILLSAGHSNADYRTAMKAFDGGLPAATHLFNAMSPFQHRAPGMAGAVMDHPSVNASIVCDGIHVDYAAVRIAKKAMGDRLFYITDAVTSSPQGAYRHVFNNDHYTLPDGTLSGSALSMMQCVKNGVQHVQLPLEESLRMATVYPARLIKQPALGKITVGADARLVVFDEQFTVKRFIEKEESIPVQ